MCVPCISSRQPVRSLDHAGAFVCSGGAAGRCGLVFARAMHVEVDVDISR